MSKKLFLTVSIIFIYFTSVSQGVIVTSGAMPCSNSSYGIAFTIGQTFNLHSPVGDSIPLVAEGIQQGYTTVGYDTLLLLSNEMAGYAPGENVLPTTTPEGYDEELHRQVYEMTCTSDTVITMTESGQPTKSVRLPEPRILPSGSVQPSGPVTLLLDRSNPYDYPVGVATVVTWTASVAGQSKECRPKVTINYYDCAGNHSSVFDFDGNSYPVVNLGYYCWTGRNMRTQHYGNGASVPNVMTYPASYAPGVADMAETFGNLYTWNAATNYNIVGTRMQGVCPDGWHIPDATETEYLLALFEAMELMSDDTQIRWIPENGTDDYGFSFLPAGYYSAGADRYEGLYVRSYFWTTETLGSTTAYACEFGSACGTIEIVPGDRSNGYSVRCVLNY